MFPQLLARGGALLVSLAGLAGCAAPETSRALQQGIVGGSATGDAQAEVVFITTATQGRVKQCSGTLIAPNLVLTALHCVSTNNPTQGVLCDPMGHPASADNASLLGPPAAPAAVEIYVGPVPAETPDANAVQIIGSGSATICANDLAFVVLDRDLALPTAPLRLDTPARIGEQLTVVGFGEDSAGPSDLRQQRTVQVTATGQWLRTFTVSEGPCLGDSGGPSLTADGQLTGVFSTVSLVCDNAAAAGKYTDISYFGALVQQAVSAASAARQADAGGSDGDSAGLAPDSDDGSIDADTDASDASAEAGSIGSDGSPPTPPNHLRAHGGCDIGGPAGSSGSFATLVMLFTACRYRRRHRAQVACMS